MNQIEEKSHILIFQGQRLHPVSSERNVVGFCSRCDAELLSLDYYSTDDDWIVSACCSNGHVILMHYDRQWNWRCDHDAQIVMDKADVSTIDKEMLEAVFTQAEIRDMLACQQKLPYTRQNLYRARAKYQKFESLFGIKLDV
jgi:hypothetical protein